MISGMHVSLILEQLNLKKMQNMQEMEHQSEPFIGLPPKPWMEVSPLKKLIVCPSFSLIMCNNTCNNRLFVWNCVMGDLP